MSYGVKRGKRKRKGEVQRLRPNKTGMSVKARRKEREWRDAVRHSDRLYEKHQQREAEADARS